MPIYEYRCTRCGAVSEVLQRVSEPPKRKCLDCSGRLEKLISRTSFHLKGGGWFAEGYANGAGKPESKGDAASGNPQAGKTEKAKGGEKKASSG